MPISVACNCGRKLKAPDQLAGQKAKCPSCGAVLAVPALTAPPAPAAPPRPAAVAPSAPVKSAPAAAPRRAAAPPPVAPVTPPTIQPSGDEYALDLGDMLPTQKPAAGAGAGTGPAAPASAAASDEARQCPACHASMTAADVMCQKCGFSPRSGTYIDRTRRGRYAGEEGPEPWFSLMGIEFTPIKTALLGVMVVLLLGLVYWYITGPGANFRIREIHSVHQVTLLPSVGVIPAGSLMQGTLFTAKPSAGVKLPPGAKTPQPVQQANKDVYGLGYGTKLVLTTDHADGDWLLMRVDIRQSYLHYLKSMSSYDYVMVADNFKVDVDGKKQDVIMITAELLSPLTIELGDSQTGDYKMMLPPDVPITSSSGDEPRSGEITYDGKNGVSGKLRYASIYLMTRVAGASGVSGDGKLEVKDARGMEATLQYNGDQLQVDWNAGARGWRSNADEKREARISPWSKHEVWLLTPRPPKDTKSVKIVLCNEEVAKVPLRWAAQREQVTTSTPQGPKGPPKKDLLDKAGEQLGGYVGALANARRRAQGTVASSNMRQLFMGLELYAQRNDGRLPEKLEDLRMYLDGFDQLLFNPRTKENPGFTYVKPNPDDVKSKPAGDVPIFYELLHGQIDPDGAVGYLDGSIDQGSAAPLKDAPVKPATP